MNYISKYEELIEELNKYLPSEDIIFIEKSYLFSKKLHENQLRKSGEPYIVHPLNVAYILATWKMAADLIVAGILHDLMEDQSVTIDTIKKEFNNNIATIVDNLTKIDKYFDKNRNSMKSINMQKILIAMAKDVQVILVKLADRMHNMNTLQYLSPERIKAIASETQDVYLPVARWLGMQNVVDAYGDKILEFLYPEIYKNIAKSLTANKEKNEIFLQKLIKDMNSFLLAKDLKLKVYGRIKNAYSIFKKINLKNQEPEDINDVFGIRIITESITDCYAVMGYLQSKHKFLKERFKDYIVQPKKNLYQSIHITLIINKINVEVQIRTEEMHEIANQGVAAHYFYKNNEKIVSDGQSTFENINNKKTFKVAASPLKNMPNNDDSNIYYQNINDIFTHNVYVITPLGDCIIMNQNSNALDFAFQVHTNLGMYADTCYINGSLKPLTTVLTNGDIVEIKINKVLKSGKELMEKVNNHHSKMAIKKFIRLQTIKIKNKKIEDGKNIIEKYIAVNEKYKLFYNSENFLSILNYPSFNDFYLAISNNNTIIKKIFHIYETQTAKTKSGKEIKNSNSLFIISDSTNIQASIGQCCLPVPGDQIVALITKDKGIKIHHRDCSNLKNAPSTNIIYDVVWNDKINNQHLFTSKLILTFFWDGKSKLEENNHTKNVINLLSKLKVIMKEMATKTSNSNSTEIHLKVLVNDLAHLQKIISSIGKIRSIEKIERVI